MQKNLKENFTVIEIIDFVAAQLTAANLYYGHGTDNPYDEAVVLVFFVLGLPFDVEEKELHKNVSQSNQTKIQKLADERITKKIPLAYLTHEAYFAGLKFYVDERVIIPRSPIAELIEQQFQPWVDPDKVKNILDLCTGSGCIAIACAKYFPDAKVDAVELSDDAIAVTKINIKKHNVANQLNLIKSDLFTNVPQKKYDIIISNPPYVSGEEMNIIPDEYHHEPKMSLYAEDEGLYFAEKILQQANNYLNKNGILIVEVGNAKDTLTKRHPHKPFIWLEFERGGDGIFLLERFD